VFILLQTDFTTKTGKHVHLYKIPIQAYHTPMPGYTVAYYVAYSLEWIRQSKAKQ